MLQRKELKSCKGVCKMLMRLLIMLNKRLSKKYGWSPRWFWASDFNAKLIKRIRALQRKHGLFPSGLCGKKTYRLALLKTLLDIKRRKD